MLSEELRRRLYLEYRYSNTMNKDSVYFMTESFGVPNVVDKMSLSFKSELGRFIECLLKKKCSFDIFKLNEDFFKSSCTDSELFFNNLNVFITVFVLDRCNINLIYNARDNNFNGKRLIDCDIEVSAFLDKSKLESDIDGCTAAFAHELIHAYEDWKRYSNGSETLIQNINKYGYKNNHARYSETQYMDKKKLSHILYFLTPSEIRGYCAQIIKNNENAISRCSSSKEAFDIIKNDTTFRNYQIVEKWLENISASDMSCSKKDIEDWWKDITGKEMVFKEIVKYLDDKMKKAKCQIIRNISKKINEISLNSSHWTAMENKNEILDETL